MKSSQSKKGGYFIKFLHYGFQETFESIYFRQGKKVNAMVDNNFLIVLVCNN